MADLTKSNLIIEGLILVYSLMFECAVHQKEDRVVTAGAALIVFPVRKWKDFFSSLQQLQDPIPWSSTVHI